jgi:hypothetical protein
MEKAARHAQRRYLGGRATWSSSRACTEETPSFGLIGEFVKREDMPSREMMFEQAQVRLGGA